MLRLKFPAAQLQSHTRQRCKLDWLDKRGRGVSGGMEASKYLLPSILRGSELLTNRNAVYYQHPKPFQWRLDFVILDTVSFLFLAH